MTDGQARQGPPLPQLQASVPTLLQALSASETSAPQLIIEAASPCKILLANKAWCDVTGFASEELVGNSVSMLHGPLTCRETLSALGLAMAAGQSLHVMLVCYGKSSQPCLSSISATPLLDSSGLPSFFQWVITGYIMLEQDAHGLAAIARQPQSASASSVGRQALKSRRSHWGPTEPFQVLHRAALRPCGGRRASPADMCASAACFGAGRHSSTCRRATRTSSPRTRATRTAPRPKAVPPVGLEASRPGPGLFCDRRGATIPAISLPVGSPGTATFPPKARP